MKTLLVLHLILPIIKVLACRDDPCNDTEIKADVPLEFDTSLVDVVVVSDVVGSIGIKTLSKLEHIQELTIRFSNITHFEDGALCSPPNLKLLSIVHSVQYPALTKGALSGCQKLKSLIIDRQLEPDALADMTNVETAFIHDQKIPHLTKESFEPMEKLKKFHSSGCQFDEVDPGVFCTSHVLEDLDFEFDRFPPITQAHFGTCKSLRRLRISYTGVDEYEASSPFNRLPRLEAPNMKHELLQVSEDAFNNLSNLESLELENLDIHNLKKEFLKGLTSLIHLSLKDCNINGISLDAFEYVPQLSRLLLVNNNLKNINSDIFRSLPNLVKLDLSYNLLTNIDEINNLPNLNALIVTGNSIRDIQVEKIKMNLPRLTYLLARENPIDPNKRDQIKDFGDLRVIIEEYGDTLKK